jgi:segregation and condensation protein B
MHDNHGYSLANVIEAKIMASADPVRVSCLQRLVCEQFSVTKADLLDKICAMQDYYRENHGFDLVEVASGYRFQVKQNMMPLIQSSIEAKQQKISRVMIETLTVIAYHQPVTRADIEAIRGVSAQSHLVRDLIEYGWVKVIGRKDIPGRPELLGTTNGFLNHFNLKSLADLPSISKPPQSDLGTLSASKAEEIML